MRLLALAELPEQAEEILAAAPEATLVALTPAVDSWAERRGLQLPTIEDYFNERNHRNLGALTIDLTEDLVVAADDLLRPLLAGQTWADAVSFAAFFHFFVSILDGIVGRLEQTTALIEATHPEEILAFRLEPVRFCGLTSLDRPCWGLASRFLPAMAVLRGIPVRWILPAGSWAEEVEELVEAFTPTPPPATKPSLLGPLRRALRSLARFPQRRKSEPVSAPPVEAPVLISSLFSDLGDDVAAAWLSRGGMIQQLGEAFPRVEDPALRAQAESWSLRLWESLRSPDSRFRRLLVWRDLDLWPFVENWLQPAVRVQLPPLIELARRAWQALADEGHHQRAALLAGGWVTDHFVLARIAALTGLPTISLHYGGYLGFSLLPKHERFDFAGCDFFLCGGPGAAKTFQEPSPHSRWRATKRAKPVPVGMPWVQRLVQQRGAASHVRQSGAGSTWTVMVVLNALMGDCRDLGFVFPPEIEYWRFTRRLVLRLAREPWIHVIAKPPLADRYPQLENPLLAWIESRRFPNISILRDVPLKDCLAQADAFVLESPSTPLLHVAATDKPLLLYINRDDYLLQEEAADKLARRCAVFGRSEEDFFSQLERFLAQGIPPYAPPDDSFLDSYVTGGPGSSADRIAAFIVKVIAERELPATRVNPQP